MAEAPPVDVRGLTKHFGSTVAVDDLTFSIRRGRVTGFLGPNGAGKSTTLRALLGLVRPSSGDARVEGSPYSELGNPLGTVGAVLEAHSFHPGRSGRNHLRVLATAAGLPVARVDEVLSEVELTRAARRRTGTYSLGMRQRLSVAGALLGRPGLLVLDEPANGLDPEGIRWLRDFLRSFAAAGGTVLVSSHVLPEVAQIADEVVIIHRGRFVEQASTAELFARAGGGIRVRSPAAEQLKAILEEAGLTVGSAERDLLVVGDATTERIGELAAEHRIVLHELAAEKSTLEEAFLELTDHETTR